MSAKRHGRILKRVIRTPLRKSSIINKSKKLGYSNVKVNAINQKRAWNLAASAGKKKRYRSGNTVGFRI